MKNYKKKHLICVSRPSANAPDSCLIADSPHSGRLYPKDFNYICAYENLRQIEDAYVDKLFGFFPKMGVPFIKALFPRSYINVNRAVTNENIEKPADGLFVRICPSSLSQRSDHYLYNYPNSEASHPLTLAERFERVRGYYMPYHQTLQQTLETTYQQHRRYVYLDCHSMKSTILNTLQKNPFDISIGTRDGTTCGHGLAEKLSEILSHKGYKVALNEKHKGRYLVEKHANPSCEKHCIQVEVNRGLYINEKTVTLIPGFVQLKKDLEQAFIIFNDYVMNLPPPAQQNTPSSFKPVS